ncbi:MAG UNVERIFIED_CONTAM: hypothetical protein LVT10_17060 [Anaerolineae bacterium]
MYSCANTSDRVFTQSTPIAPDSPLYASATLTLPPGAIIGGTGGNQSTRYQIDQENFRVTDTQPIVPDVAASACRWCISYPLRTTQIIEHELNYLLNGESAPAGCPHRFTGTKPTTAFPARRSHWHPNL